MIVSSALSIIIVKIYKCMKKKQERKDITPLADLEKDKITRDTKTKGLDDDTAGYETKTGTELTQNTNQ